MKIDHKTERIYPAEVESVYDGDTVRLNIDLGFKTWVRNQSCRLLGIDAPEIRGPERNEGLRSKAHLVDLLKFRAKEVSNVTVVVRKSSNTGKYGRWLVTIYKDGVNLNDVMVERGWAEKYEK